MRRAAVIVLAMAVGVSVIGCKKGPSRQRVGSGGQTGSGTAAPGASADDNPLIEKLSEDELKSYLAITPELHKRFKDIPSWRAGLAFVGVEFQTFFASKGTTAEKYFRAQAKAMHALTALHIKQAIEATPPGLRPQVEAMYRPYKDVPEGNLELVRKYKGQLEALGGTDDAGAETPPGEESPDDESSEEEE